MPISQMRGLAARAAQNFDYYAGVVTELHGRSFQVGDEFLNYTIRKPVGVAGLIMPWNAPLMLSTWRHRTGARRRQHRRAQARRVVAAHRDAAGRRCSRRPGCRRASFNVVHGFGETAGAPLSAHPGVDLICFTGETTTGQAIIAAGAPTLKRSSVELGGKSPVVVFEDADAGARRRRRARPDLHDERPALHGRLAAARPASRSTSGSSTAVAERARNIRVGDPFDPRTELGPLITPEHHERVLELHRLGARARARASWPAASGRPALRARQLPRGDRDRRRRRDDARLPGGDLRARARGDAVRGRGRGGPARERDAVRARRLRLDERPPARPSRRARDRHRHVLDQLAERPRPAHAVRRRQGIAASAARAATTRSTSTARPRSCTSRSARTTSRGSGLGDEGGGASVSTRHRARRAQPCRSRPTTSCAPRTPSCTSPTSTASRALLRRPARAGRRRARTDDALYLRGWEERLHHSLVLRRGAGRRPRRALRSGSARDADLDLLAAGLRARAAATARWVDGPEPGHRAGAARLGPVRLPARVLPRDGAVRDAAAALRPPPRRADHAASTTSTCTRPHVEDAFALLARARLPLLRVHLDRRATTSASPAPGCCASRPSTTSR